MSPLPFHCRVIIGDSNGSLILAFNPIPAFEEIIWDQPRIIVTFCFRLVSKLGHSLTNWSIWKITLRLVDFNGTPHDLMRTSTTEEKWATSWQKPTKWLCPAKAQISLGIHPFWSESSLSAWRNTGSSATHGAHCEDWLDWAMLRLICVFAGHAVILLVLSCPGSNKW